jgi:PAS domain S-box-containing protein
MSLKTRLRIAIVALVTFVVVGVSGLYLYDFTRLSFRSALERADVIADEVYGYLIDRLNVPRPALDTSSAAPQENWTGRLRNDSAIKRTLTRMLANAKLVLTIQVTDARGELLVASDDTPLGPTRDMHEVQNGFWLANLWRLLNRSEEYVTTRSLGANGQTLFHVVVVVKSDFLRNDIQPALENLAGAFASSLCIAVFLAYLLPNFVLAPLGRTSQILDRILAGQFETALPAAQGESREFADVQSKLNILGERFRGARQDVVELRSNIEQLLQRLEETVLLFDNSGRLMMAGAPAERMLGKTHDELVGQTVTELFPAGSVLGQVIGNAVRSGEAVRDHPITISRDGLGPLRLLVSVQLVRKNPSLEEIGTLITIRDVESRRQLERQLDLSSRLAALSRLTGGVAHEIKNPLNAMALHLEVLRNKLDNEEPEVNVIAREIKRLDNVVKTFLNFNKPIELQSRLIDLSQLVEQVIALVSPEAQAKSVTIETDLQDRLLINGDSDLLQQAILNVVNNGLEAMGNGGHLTVCTAWDGDDCQLTIRDGGPGIAPDIQDRIFNLYFTTKEHGSGIGLATTFRIIQLHSGTIDFASEVGKGTTFRMRFPGMVDYRGEVLSSAKGNS